jgi:hypothetical protein
MGQVVKEVEAMEAHEEFFSDCVCVGVVEINSLVMQWPRHRQMIETLKGSQISVIDYRAMRLLFPGTKARSIVSLLNYYSTYEFMDVSRRNQSSEEDETVRQIVAQVEERISVMIGCAIPTAGERLIERKRLDMLADKEREKETRLQKKSFSFKKKKKGNLFPVGPTFVPNVKHNTVSERANDGVVTVFLKRLPCWM